MVERSYFCIRKELISKRENERLIETYKNMTFNDKLLFYKKC